ncbi:hypothetical protein Tco_0952428 [Tanacetum coccineum]|uniref:Reverse transcriptase domain-containing protein n=1 Tax=Tanacetum coccineum TaxID=301880 RepID=A0ABQ5DYT4_9ASTR
MRTRNSNFPNNSNVTILRRRNRGRAPNVVEPELRTIVEVAPMAERTMEELLRAPTEGYGEAIVLPEINADHFEIKTNLLQLVQASPFHGFERENPHAHINSFKRITSTLRFRDEKLLELAKIPLNENCSAMLLKKLPKNLGDPGKFLFEFDDNYNSSDINPLFKEILEDVESKDSNVSNFDEPVLLNTPLFDEDECFDPGGDNDEIDAFLAIEISTYIEEGYYDRWRCILSWKIA